MEAMKAELILKKLSKKSSFSRGDIFQAFHEEGADAGSSSFSWRLYDLLKEKKLYKTGRDSYSLSKPTSSVYKPRYSEEAAKVSSLLSKRFPNVSFVVFESTLLNEWLNHLIAQDTIFVQVEKGVSEFVFEVLREEYKKTVLCKPSQRDFERYWQRDCLIVLDLVSQAPLSKESPHEIVLEKLLVDILAEKAMSMTYSPGDLPLLFEEVAKVYSIDKKRLARYAGRRNALSKIGKYIGG